MNNRSGKAGCLIACFNGLKIIPFYIFAALIVDDNLYFDIN